MGGSLIRIISDVHFADRGSRVRSLGQLRPLLEGASAFVFNGDTLDTRRGKRPGWTEERRREVLDYFGAVGTPVTFLTGNHDPDMSNEHALEFAGGRVFVTHGDVLFDNIVPWSRDADRIRAKIIAALAAIPDGAGSRFEGRIAAFRSVAAAIPQLHQSERNPVKYAARLALDTVWPPTRALTITQAWREVPARAASFAAKHRPRAQVIIVGHTHKPGAWRTPGGVSVINTGSFTIPFGAYAAEVTEGRVAALRVERRGGEYRLGPVVDEFRLS